MNHLTVCQIFSVQAIASERESSGDDRAVPKREPAHLADGQCRSEYVKVHVLYAESCPRVDPTDSELMRDCIAAAELGGLNVELLLDLDRYRARIVV